MKKLLILLSISLASTFVQAEDFDDEIQFFESNSVHQDAEPGTGSDLPDDGVAPINDYIPFLLGSVVIIGVKYRKKLSIK